MTENKKQRRQFWFVLVIVFLGFIGISMPYLIFPALFLNPDYSILSTDWGQSSRAIFLGITLAAYPLGQFIGSPTLGALSDDYGRKRLLTGTLLVTGFCNLFTAFAIGWHNVWLLILSRFLAGLMEGNIAIARAMAADMKTIGKHEAFGKINAASSIAFLFGPLLGGVLTDKSLFDGLTTATPFYFICILFFAITTLSQLVLEKRPVTGNLQVRSFFERINLFKRLSRLFCNKRLQFLMLTSTCFTLAVDIFYEFGPVYLTLKWTLEPSQLIIYNGVLCVTLALGNGWLPSFFSTRMANQRAIIASITGFSIILIGMTLTNSTFLMMSLFACAGFVIGLAVTLLTVKISDSASDQIQGEVMGVQQSLRVLGDAVICLLGGVLLLFSPIIILVIASLLSFSAMCYYTFRPQRAASL